MGSVFLVLKSAGMLRVSTAEEMQGLDITEHGNMSYPDFVSGIPAGTSRSTDDGIAGEVAPVVPS